MPRSPPTAPPWSGSPPRGAGCLPRTSRACARTQRRSDATYEAFVDLLLARASASEDDAEQQALLRETRRVLETRKAVELRDYFRDACLDAHRQAEPDDIPGTLVLYPVLLEDRMELIASRDGRFWQFTVPIGSAELADLTRRYRSNLENLTTRRHLRESIALHELVIEPVLPLIEDEQTRSLVFVAEGSLRTIPIGALRDSVRGRYLIERIPVSVTPSLTLTNPGAVEPDRVRVLRAGISQSIDGFAALPAVAGELEAIGERYQGDELLDEAFDSASLADALERRPYGIVHIASHGEFLPDSSESYLLAWQDRITMDELSSLLGATQFRGQGVQLLTLSACQTAAGDERAALGLAGLAVKAGARSALATLWSISDVAASRLIDRFYEELAKPDVSRAEALRRAQLEISQQPEWAHPGYWAAFMLIGDWT